MIIKPNENRIIRLSTKFLLEGIWKVVHRDKYGNILSVDFSKNLLPDAAIDYLLNAGVHGGTQISTWYFAPFTNDYTPTASDTYAVPGYTEANTEYQETTRQEWAEGASSGQSITNATAATITGAAGGGTFYGAGIVGGGTQASTKADTGGGGTLLAADKFSTAKTLAENETLDMTYTLSGASS